MSRRALRAGAGTMLLLAVAAPLPPAAAQAADPYSRLIYDYEVALICGLGDIDMQHAYERARARLEAASTLPVVELTKRRRHAMAAAELEYDNRGLGGFRPWCRTEGRSGVARILEAGKD